MNSRLLVRLAVSLTAGLVAFVFVELAVTTLLPLAERATSDLWIALYLIFSPQQSQHLIACSAGAVALILAWLLVPDSREIPARAIAVRLIAVGALMAIVTMVGAAIGWLLATPGWSSQIASTRWWLTDHQPPDIRLVVPQAPVRGDALISIETSDEGEHRVTRFTVDGIAIPPAPLVNLDTSTLPDGAHIVVVEAEDASRQRNIAQAQATFRSETRWWLTDVTPPVITVTVPTTIVQGIASIAVTTWDAGEHRITRMSVDGVTVPITLPLIVDTTRLPDGEHSILVEAEDASRQQNRTQVKAVLRSDNKPPGITVRFDPPLATQGHVQVLYLTPDEPVVAITATLANQPLILARTGDSYWAIRGFAPDAAIESLPVSVRLVDIVGHTTQVTATQVVTRFAFPVENVTGEAITIPPDRAYLLDPAISLSETTYLDTVFAAVTPDVLWRDTFAVPVRGRQTSPFAIRRSYNGGPLGSYHGGVDIAADAGVPVLAANRGQVVLAEALKIRGNAVILDHGMGVYSSYYHLSEIRVRKGQMVEKGQVIGLVGNTGLSTGPHLHWELRVTGKAVAPWIWTERAIP